MVDIFITNAIKKVGQQFYVVGHNSNRYEGWVLEYTAISQIHELISGMIACAKTSIFNILENIHFLPPSCATSHILFLIKM